jgi:regulator of sirC expression with transglutaminase-like and TPR domain
MVILPTSERKAIFSRLDRNSLSKQLAFYRLFPETEEGKKAYQQACFLLQGKSNSPLPPLPTTLLDSIVNAVASNPSSVPSSFNKEELELIRTLSDGFQNRQLKGSKLLNEKEILSLSPEEIDLGRALLVSQGSDVERFEAIFDIMALHIQAKLRKGAKPIEIVNALTTFIFDEMGFRFPPHSASVPEIDKYTALPSVVDARRGVCLGVSILYLCLAQRLGLALEIITPPGHIFVRYEGEGGPFNIETTARGVHLPDQTYLNLEYCHLTKRTIKEVVGMAHMNEASTYWHKGEYEKVLQFYEKALPYLEEDPLLHELMGYVNLLLGKEDVAKHHFAKADLKPTSFATDYLTGCCNAKGIELLFQQNDKDRNSLMAHRVKIENILKDWPTFKAGWFYHAMLSMQLSRVKDALLSLEKYHALDATHPTVEYYLAELYFDRGQYQEGWKHQKILAALFPADPPLQIEELRVKLLEKSYLSD